MKPEIPSQATPLERTQFKNAEKLEKLFEKSGFKISDDWDFKRLKSGGYMDLCVDKLGTNEDGVVTIALAHNAKQNGDNMADPDMEMAYIPAGELLPARMQARHYQNDFVGAYNTVAQGNTTQKDLDQFLGQWLDNLKEQGHKLEQVPEATKKATPTIEERWAQKPSNEEPSSTNGTKKDNKSIFKR